MKIRVLSLALIALALQATLPFLTTNCPFYQSGQSIGHAGSAQASSMPANCPMLADMPAGPSDTGPHKSHPAGFCALCNVLSPFHGYVAAGLLSLPPPRSTTQFVTFVIKSYTAPSVQTRSFSARAPPVVSI